MCPVRHYLFPLFCTGCTSQRAEQEIARISKKWSGLLKEAYTDSDTFGVTFSKNLDNHSKYILLGAVFLIDFLYFEK